MPAPNKEINKEAVHMLYIELGATEAASRMGIKKGTVTKWASRYGWSKQRAVPLKPGRPPLSQIVAEPVSGQLEAGSEPVQCPVSGAVSGPAALKEAHAALNGRTRTALAQATAAAAEQVAAAGFRPVANAAEFQKLAAAASRIFAWDEGKSTGDTYNTLVITPEQLKQIGMLQGA